MKAKLKIRNQSRLIVYLCTFLYFTSYVLRLNFAVMLVKICTDLNAQKSQVAIVVTSLTLAYGIGQVISGALGDKFKPQIIIAIGMIMASVCNMLMFFSNSIYAMAAIWALNGFSHSLFWPPILKLFSQYLNDVEYSYGVVRVSWGSSVGSIALYLICPLLLKFISWRQIILCCSVLGFAVAVFWIISSPRVFNKKYLNEDIPERISQKGSSDSKAAVKLPKSIYLPIAMIMVAIILQGILRDGVTNWMPSFLLETFNIPEENAIVCTVILGVFGMISFGLFEWVRMRFFKTEVNCAMFIFSVASLFSLLLFLVNKAFTSAVISMILMASIVACMHGINLMLIGMFPKNFAKVGKVSTFSGIVNSAGYIGASLSTYVFAVLTEKFGWDLTVFTWIIVSLLGILCCWAAISFGWKRKFKDYLS